MGWGGHTRTTTFEDGWRMSTSPPSTRRIVDSRAFVLSKTAKQSDPASPRAMPTMAPLAGRLKDPIQGGGPAVGRQARLIWEQGAARCHEQAGRAHTDQRSSRVGLAPMPRRSSSGGAYHPNRDYPACPVEGTQRIVFDGTDQPACGQEVERLVAFNSGGKCATMSSPVAADRGANQMAVVFCRSVRRSSRAGRQRACLHRHIHTAQPFVAVFLRLLRHDRGQLSSGCRFHDILLSLERRKAILQHASVWSITLAIIPIQGGAAAGSAP